MLKGIDQAGATRREIAGGKLGKMKVVNAVLGRIKRLSATRRAELVLVLALFLALSIGHAAHAQSGGQTLADGIKAFFSDAMSTFASIAAPCAFLGIGVAGIMYIGSGWPIIGPWKQEHPRLFTEIMIGMAVLGGLSTFVSFVHVSPPPMQ